MNKQRITKLSRREVEAHQATSSIWGAGIIPRDETLSILQVHKIEGEAAEGIIAGAIDSLGLYRMDENFRENRLSRAEMIKQADQTAAVALELYNRILHMDPYIRAWADSDSFRVWGVGAFPDDEKKNLVRIHALMRAAANKAKSLPSKVPSRTAHRNRLLTDIVLLLQKYAPCMTGPKYREIATMLLGCWGVAAPSDDGKVRKAIKRAK